MTLHFPAEMVAEIFAEAKRIGRSRSWLMQRAWRLARAELRLIAGANDDEPGDDET